MCDVTARDLQRKDGQWTRAKGFDTFCPVGPYVETAFDPRAARVLCRVNGQARQDGSTSNMIFDVAALAPVVERVGPAPEEIQTPPTEDLFPRGDVNKPLSGATIF